MERDEELEKVIENAVGKCNGDYLQALDKVIAFKKEKRGLKGFHVTPSLDLFLGKERDIDPLEEVNKMAHDVLMMELSHARGQYREITGEELERM